MLLISLHQLHLWVVLFLRTMTCGGLDDGAFGSLVYSSRVLVRVGSWLLAWSYLASGMWMEL